MGQKVHPVGIRLAIAGYERKITSFPARKKDLVLQTSENIQVMEFIKKHYKQAGIGQVKIDRPGNQVNVRIFCAKPGFSRCTGVSTSSCMVCSEDSNLSLEWHAP